MTVPSQTFDLESDSSYLKPLRESLRELLAKSGMPEKDLESVLVAIGEAFTNSLRHSYQGQAGHKIQVSFEDQPDKVILKVRDYGLKIDPNAIPEPTLPPVKGGGLGVYFIKTIMDELEYNTRHLEGNELIMTKYKKSQNP
jgi:serine/threonine-protein kinase RsbW